MDFIKLLSFFFLLLSFHVTFGRSYTNRDFLPGLHIFHEEGHNTALQAILRPESTKGTHQHAGNAAVDSHANVRGN